MRRTGVVAVTLILTAAVFVLHASPAAACSCGGTVQPAAMSGDGSAAFVGRVRHAPAGSLVTGSNEPVTWTFDVEEVYVGELGPQINVVTPAAGPSCGLDDLDVGDRRAVAVRWTDELMVGDLGEARWVSERCSVAEPSAFEGSVEPHPPDPAIAAGPTAPARGSEPLLLAVAAVGLSALLALAIGAAAVARRRRPSSA